MCPHGSRARRCPPRLLSLKNKRENSLCCLPVQRLTRLVHLVRCRERPRRMSRVSTVAMAPLASARNRCRRALRTLRSRCHRACKMAHNRCRRACVMFHKALTMDRKICRRDQLASLGQVGVCHREAQVWGMARRCSPLHGILILARPWGRARAWLAALPLFRSRVITRSPRLILAPPSRRPVLPLLRLLCRVHLIAIVLSRELARSLTAGAIPAS